MLEVSKQRGKVPSNKWIAAISQQATWRCVLTVEDGANQSNREETGRTVQEKEF